jgi:hypothetical protein
MSDEKRYSILMVLLTLSIIGGLFSIALWNTVPDMRNTLIVNYNEAIITAGIVAILNLVALISLIMKIKWGPLLVIAIVIPNRVLGFFHFGITAGQVPFISWSAILIIFALFDYKKKTKTITHHNILSIMISLAIIGEIASIILWTINPSIGNGNNARFTLAVDYTIAVLNAAIMVVLNFIALYWIRKRNKWGPLFLIGISIGNRMASHPIFIGGTHGIFVTWTAVLVIFSYLEYRQQST